MSNASAAAALWLQLRRTQGHPPLAPSLPTDRRATWLIPIVGASPRCHSYSTPPTQTFEPHVRLDVFGHHFADLPLVVHATSRTHLPSHVHSPCTPHPAATSRACSCHLLPLARLPQTKPEQPTNCTVAPPIPLNFVRAPKPPSHPNQSGEHPPV